jgi:hypothetical protein
VDGVFLPVLIVIIADWGIWASQRGRGEVRLVATGAPPTPAAAVTDRLLGSTRFEHDHKDAK